TKRSVLASLTDQGSLVPTDEQEFVAAPTVGDLEVTTVSAAAQLGKTTSNYVNLWLHSKSPSDHGEMLLTPNGAWPELSPTDGAVFYIDGGVAKVQELII